MDRSGSGGACTGHCARWRGSRGATVWLRSRPAAVSPTVDGLRLQGTAALSGTVGFLKPFLSLLVWRTQSFVLRALLLNAGLFLMGVGFVDVCEMVSSHCLLLLHTAPSISRCFACSHSHFVKFGGCEV